MRGDFGARALRRMPIHWGHRTVSLLGVVLASGCAMVLDLPTPALGGGVDAGGADVATAEPDGGIPDGASTDGDTNGEAATDGAIPFTCTGSDATLCDDFADGGSLPIWTVSTSGDGGVSFPSGAFRAYVPSGSGSAWAGLKTIQALGPSVRVRTRMTLASFEGQWANLVYVGSNLLGVEVNLDASGLLTVKVTDQNDGGTVLGPKVMGNLIVGRSFDVEVKVTASSLTTTLNGLGGTPSSMPPISGTGQVAVAAGLNNMDRTSDAAPPTGTELLVDYVAIWLE